MQTPPVDMPAAEPTASTEAPAVPPSAAAPAGRRARRPRLPPLVRLGIVAVLGACAGLLMSYLMRKVGY